jgi:hypothetical protein
MRSSLKKPDDGSRTGEVLSRLITGPGGRQDLDKSIKEITHLNLEIDFTTRLIRKSRRTDQGSFLPE